MQGEKNIGKVKRGNKKKIEKAQPCADFFFFFPSFFSPPPPSPSLKWWYICGIQ
jgi:hypothetical protein